MKCEGRGVRVEPERVSRNGKRFFSEAHKRAVVEECLSPGASVSAVALAHGFNANLVRKWMARYQVAEEWGRPSGTLVPVGVVDGSGTLTTQSRRNGGKRELEAVGGWIEIEAGGARVVLRGRVEAELLCGVLEAVGRWR